MNFQLNLSLPFRVIGEDIHLFESPRHFLRVEDALILVCQHSVVVFAGREDPLHGRGGAALEPVCFGIDQTRRVRGREREQRLVARVDDVLLRAERRARAGHVPLAVADQAAFLFRC